MLFLVVVILLLLVLDVLLLLVVHLAVEITLLALMVDCYMLNFSSIVIQATGIFPWLHLLWWPPLLLLPFSSSSSLPPQSMVSGCYCWQIVLGEVGPTYGDLQHGGTRPCRGTFQYSDWKECAMEWGDITISQFTWTQGFRWKRRRTTRVSR